MNLTSTIPPEGGGKTQAQKNKMWKKFTKGLSMHTMAAYTRLVDELQPRPEHDMSLHEEREVEEIKEELDTVYKLKRSYSSPALPLETQVLRAKHWADVLKNGNGGTEMSESSVSSVDIKSALFQPSVQGTEATPLPKAGEAQHIPDPSSHPHHHHHHHAASKTEQNKTAESPDLVDSAEWERKKGSEQSPQSPPDIRTKLVENELTSVTSISCSDQDETSSDEESGPALVTRYNKHGGVMKDEFDDEDELRSGLADQNNSYNSKSSKIYRKSPTVRSYQSLQNRKRKQELSKPHKIKKKKKDLILVDLNDVTIYRPLLGLRHIPPRSFPPKPTEPSASPSASPVAAPAAAQSVSGPGTSHVGRSPSGSPLSSTKKSDSRTAGGVGGAAPGPGAQPASAAVSDQAAGSTPFKPIPLSKSPVKSPALVLSPSLRSHISLRSRHRIGRRRSMMNLRDLTNFSTQHDAVVYNVQFGYAKPETSSHNPAAEGSENLNENQESSENATSGEVGNQSEAAHSNKGKNEGEHGSAETKDAGDTDEKNSKNPNPNPNLTPKISMKKKLRKFKLVSDLKKAANKAGNDSGGSKGLNNRVMSEREREMEMMARFEKSAQEVDLSLSLSKSLSLYIYTYRSTP